MIKKIQTNWHRFWMNHHDDRMAFFNRIAMHHLKIADRHAVKLYNKTKREADKTKRVAYSQMIGRGKRS